MSRSSRTALTLAVTFFWASSAAGDPAADFAARRDYPFISAAYAGLPSAAFEAANVEAELAAKENRFAVGLWRWGSDSTRYDVGLDYQYTRYTYAGIDGRNRDLHRLQVPLGIRHRAETWDLSAYLAPGVATSSNVMKELFDRGSGDDYLVTAHVETRFGDADAHGWLVGAAWDRAFGRERLHPVLGFLFRPSDRLTARLVWPDPALRFRWTDRQRLALRLYPAGFEWHVVSDELEDAFDYRVEAWRLECGWSYQLASAFWLDLSLGYEFDRRFRFRDDSGRLIDSAVDSQWMLSAGIRWRDGPLPYTHQVARIP